MKSVRFASLTCVNVVLLLASAAFAFSCKSKSDLSNHIPKEASAVMTVDVKSMAVKSLDFKQLLTIGHLKKFMGGIGEKNDSISESLANSGLDFASTIYVFGQAQDENRYGAVLGRLSDAAKFEEFLKKSYSLTVTEEDNMKFAKFAEDQGIVGWNKEDVYMVFGDQLGKERIITLAGLKKEESLAVASESFKLSQKEGGDISLWVNFSHVAKLIPQYSGGAAPAMDLTDTYMSASCNFEDGQVVTDIKYTTNAENADKYKIMKPSVNADVAKALPGNTVIALIGIAIDMDKVYKQMEQQNLVQAYDPTVTQLTGLSTRQLMNMLSGDFAISVNGITIKEQQIMNPVTHQMTTTHQPVPNYAISVGIADKEPLFKLLDQFVTSGMLTKKANYYTLKDQIFIAEKGPAMIIASSQAATGPLTDTERLNGNLLTLLTSNSSMLFIDPAIIPDEAYGESGAAFRDNIKMSELESITITGELGKGTTSEGKIIVQFKNKKENALVTISRVSKEFKSMRQQAQPAVAADSTAAPNF